MRYLFLLFFFFFSSGFSFACSYNCDCPPGPQGPQGIQGEQGPQGEAGIAIAGRSGATGAVGAEGSAGPQGERGLAGPQGQTGPQGERGLAGPMGDNGYGAISGAMAISSLESAYKGEQVIGVGTAYFHDASALAIGYGKSFDSNFSIKVSAFVSDYDSSTDAGVAGSLSYHFK